MSNVFNIANITRVNIYFRVSTVKQSHDQRSGFDKQTYECEEYSKNVLKFRGEIGYYCDIGSSYNNKCILKQQNKMLKDLEYGSLILIHDVSRLGRNILQVQKLLFKVRERNCFIISVIDKVCYGKSRLQDKKFWYKIIESEEASDKKSYNTTRYIRNIQQKGGHIGRAPFGYAVQKMNNIPRLIKDDEEQKALKFIKQEIRKGRSYSHIAEDLNVNFNDKRGNEWTEYNVKTVNIHIKPKTFKLKKAPIEEAMEGLNIN